MRIGIFTNFYKPAINGVVRSVCVFREELARQGHDVYIFAPEAHDYEDREPNVLRYRALEIEHPVNVALAFPYLPAIDKLIPQLGLDVIHSQHPVVLGNEAARQARRCEIPLLFTYHSHYEIYAPLFHMNPKLFTTMTREIVGRYLESCQRVIVPSLSIRVLLARIYSKVLPRVVTLPTPINLRTFQQLDPGPVRERYGLWDGFNWITVSRLSLEKGLPALLRAFAQLSRDRRDARLLVVGDGPLRHDLEQLVEELGLARRVLFTGAVPLDQVPHYLAAADAFVSAALHETQGLSLVEAMAAGLPVVAMRASGSRDLIVHGENGLLTRPDEAALAAGMHRLMSDRALREALAAAGRGTATRYAAPEVTRRLVEVYGEAIAERLHYPQPGV